MNRMVVLLPFEDQPREVAEVVEVEAWDVIMVQLCNPQPPDDGLREVTPDQIQTFENYLSEAIDSNDYADRLAWLVSNGWNTLEVDLL
jgi:hypothetical protein